MSIALTLHVSWALQTGAAALIVIYADFETVYSLHSGFLTHKD